MAAAPLDLSSIAAGLLAYALSVVASVVLVFLTYRLNTLLTSRVEEERLLAAGHRAIAISLGSILLSQAILLRHAVFPIMSVVRDLFLAPLSWRAALWVLAQSALFFTLIAILSLGSVALATWLFTRMTGALREHEEILKDNVAVAIFFGFVVLGITLIVNEGLEDLSRSLIPYGETGILRIP